MSYGHTLPKIVNAPISDHVVNPLILIWNEERTSLRGVLFDKLSCEQCVYDQRILRPFSLGEHHLPLYATCPECKCVYDFPQLS